MPLLYTQDKTSPPGNLLEAKRPITIRHLLTHNSGLTYHWNARIGKQYREAGMGHGVLHQEGTIAAAVKRLAKDYYRFCQMMLNGGKLGDSRILSRKFVELISQNHIQGSSATFGYGLGFGVNSETRQLTELGLLGAYNWGGFFHTGFVIDPKEDMIAIFMGQLHPTGGLDLDAKTMRYQAIID